MTEYSFNLNATINDYFYFFRYPDSTFGNETYLMPGYPWGFMLRDILQMDTTLEEGVGRITGAQRTCDLLLGVGDGNAASGMGAFRGIQYSPGPANVFDDTNLEPSEYDWHPRIKHVVYWGMDWICPNDNRMLSHQLNLYYGNITAFNTIHFILPYVQTGSLHVAIYDHALGKMHISTARGDGETGQLDAYARQYIELDTNKLWSERAP